MSFQSPTLSALLTLVSYMSGYRDCPALFSMGSILCNISFLGFSAPSLQRFKHDLNVYPINLSNQCIAKSAHLPALRPITVSALVQIPNAQSKYNEFSGWVLTG